MKAVYIGEFGREGFDHVQLKEVPDPAEPTADEVIVRVHAAGLNRADLLQVKGLYPPPNGVSPNIPGLEFAGEIVSLGARTDGWQPGDRVFGITAGEAQAELLRIDHRLLMKIPERLDFVEAAAIPEAFITAHDALITQAGLMSGEMVLIHAVGSGVGLAALQIAMFKAAKVIGTSRTPEKLENCRSLGLEHGIAVTDIGELSSAVLALTDGRGANVILDLVGAAYFEQNLACIAERGRLVLVGLTSGAQAEINLGSVLRKRAKIIGTVLRGRTLAEKADATDRFVRDLMPALADGGITPNLDRVFAAGDASAAYKYVALNENFGKVILKFSV